MPTHWGSLKSFSASLNDALFQTLLILFLTCTPWWSNIGADSDSLAFRKVLIWPGVQLLVSR